MFLNIALLIAGVLFLAYGIKNRLKFWIIIGLVVVLLGGVSACVDYASAADGINNARVPFVIDRLGK